MARITAWAEANSSPVPRTLDATSVRNWLSASVSALKVDFDFAMDALSSTRETWIQFNDVDPKTGNSYEQDFQIKYIKMGKSIKGMLDHIHRWAAQRELLVPAEIDYNLLKTYSQQPRSVREDLYDFIMTALADAQPIAVKTLIKLDEIDPVSGITPRAAFLNHYTRSGRSAKLILAYATQWAKDNGRDVPKGLSERMIAKWPKFASSANAEMFSFVMDALPSAPSASASKVVRIELDARDATTGRTPRELFLEEYERMGRSIKHIYEHLTQWSAQKGLSVPEDLTVAVMKTWVQVARTASLDAIDLTMKALQSATSPTVAAIPYVQLDAVDETTGITPRQVFVGAYEKNGRSLTAIFDQIEKRKANGDEVPSGLTPSMISSWVERAQSARRDFFDLVLDILKDEEAIRPIITRIEQKAKTVRARPTKNALD
jgi:hypothetical protein